VLNAPTSVTDVLKNAKFSVTK